jgi:hypothetical protein
MAVRAKGMTRGTDDEITKLISLCMYFTADNNTTE